MATSLMDTIVRRMVGCYTAEHGAVPKADQHKLAVELTAALLADKLSNHELELSEWLNKTHVDWMVMGPDPENAVESSKAEQFNARWPKVLSVITRWSE